MAEGHASWPRESWPTARPLPTECRLPTGRLRQVKGPVGGPASCLAGWLYLDLLCAVTLVTHTHISGRPPSLLLGGRVLQCCCRQTV